MKLLPTLLLGVLAACTSVPLTSMDMLIDRPVRVEGVAGDTLQISNRGPGQLGYEYRTDAGTLAQGEIGVGVLLELDMREVRELRLHPLQGGSNEVRLHYCAGEGARLYLAWE
jgi:hypothetical protein